MKCKQCGSSEIERDPARGDAVCTACGTVLEDNIIVAEVEFQESAGGGASAVGQFVSADSKGGATGFGGAFNVGVGQESREITIRKARQGIMALCQQLRLNQQCIEMACNFFKMSLSRHLTKGRPSSHIHAACVYITCRTEGTAHLLIDISDALNICCYQLGRTYLRLSRALCINIPSIDPCLYILRFAAQLQFGERKHEVSMTALRLVQRMKRDSIHSGRRPSGLCGAALLIAARLHDFSRSPGDVVRIVKVHESTLRKRLLEFGETPSSALTLEEFLTVDLEEEQDPPAFRAARKRDKERLQKLMDEEGGDKELTRLQVEIDKFIDSKESRTKRKSSTLASVLSNSDVDEKCLESVEAEKFAVEETLGVLEEITSDVTPAATSASVQKGLGPDFSVLGLGGGAGAGVAEEAPGRPARAAYCIDLRAEDELVMDERDEADIDSLIFSSEDSAHKSRVWHNANATYLRDQKIKEEMRAREREEGKDKKKKVRGNYRKKNTTAANSAGEAIEKMLQEKRISSKINYDILKSLTDGEPAPSTPLSVTDTAPPAAAAAPPPAAVAIDSSPAAPTTPRRKPKAEPLVLESPAPPSKRSRRRAPAAPSPAPPATAPAAAAPATPAAPPTPATPALSEAAEEEDAEGEAEGEAEAEAEGAGEMESLASMLRAGDDDYYDYDEY